MVDDGDGRLFEMAEAEAGISALVLGRPTGPNPNHEPCGDDARLHRREWERWYGIDVSKTCDLIGSQSLFGPASTPRQL
jgi:hypothetical protein